MVKLAKVYIWGELAGTVLWNVDRQFASFEYDPDFGLELSPLTMTVEAGRPYSFSELSKDTFMGLPGLLADALPDAYGKALLDRWLASLGRSFANPVERLCYQGQRSMGALEFVPAIDDYSRAGDSFEIESLVKIATEVLNTKKSFGVNLKKDTKEAIANIIRVGTSAGGQRAKAVIAYNEETGEVCSGQLPAPQGFSHWLLKLDGVTNALLGDPRHFGRIEYVYYQMAKEAGLQMTECKLFEENGRAHFMTRRFDRVGGNEKLHTLTLCGLAHYDYKMLHAYSYEQVFQVMRRLRLPYEDAEQMFRRMVFNVVARNQDDHTKNISFIMDKKGVWRLAPAYDVTWAYNQAGDWTSSHQMSINNKWDDIQRSDIEAVAKAMNIKHSKEIIEQVNEAVGKWSALAKRQKIPTSIIKQIDQTLLYHFGTKLSKIR